MKNKDYGEKAEKIYKQIQQEKRRKEYLKQIKKALKRINEVFK